MCSCIGDTHKLVVPSYLCYRTSLTDIATYVHLADNVVVLDASGSMTYSGPSAEYLASNSDIAKGQDKEQPEEPTQIYKPEDYEEDAVEKVEEPKFEDNVDTVKRQTGDLGVWKYYAKSIGGLYIVITAICIAINVFGNNFQSEPWNSLVNKNNANHFNRTLAAMEYWYI
jgi:hypothetical protein